MVPDEEQGRREMSTEKPTETPPSPVAPAKGARPYRAPTLRRLGSVREVTWGAGSGYEAAQSNGMGLMKGK
jgi:hypothetical protein